MSTLSDLIDRLQTAPQGSAELSAEVARDFVGLPFHEWPYWIHTSSRMHDFAALGPCPAYTTSMDAALSLVPKDEPWNAGWETSNPHGMAWVGAAGHLVTAATPELALCLAAIKVAQAGAGE